MNVGEMQKGLEEISQYKGVAYGRAHELFDREDAYGLEATMFKGYLALSNGFKGFLARRLRRDTEYDAVRCVFGKTAA